MFGLHGGPSQTFTEGSPLLAQARSKDWIVDLSLDVLQAAWIISYLSFLPFRSIVVALRGLAPHTATPLNALKPALLLK